MPRKIRELVRDLKKSGGKIATNSNSRRYELLIWIVRHRQPNGFHSGSADFRSRMADLGWVGLEPTTNAFRNPVESVANG